MGVGGQHHAPAVLRPGKRPGTQCIEGWVGPRTGLDECEKSRPHRDSIPDRPLHSESLYRLSYPGVCVTCNEQGHIITVLRTAAVTRCPGRCGPSKRYTSRARCGDKRNNLRFRVTCLRVSFGWKFRIGWIWNTSRMGMQFIEYKIITYTIKSSLTDSSSKITTLECY